MKNRFVFALVLLLILSTIKIENILKYNSKFNIKHVEIENNMILSDSEIKASLAFLYETNFFLLKSNDIKRKLKEIDFVDSFKIKKIYPNKIKIIIFEKEPIAILHNKKLKSIIQVKVKQLTFLILKNTIIYQ